MLPAGPRRDARGHVHARAGSGVSIARDLVNGRIRRGRTQTPTGPSRWPPPGDDRPPRVGQARSPAGTPTQARPRAVRQGK